MTEFCIVWASPVARHRDRYFEQINDVASSGLAPELSAALQRTAGQQISCKYGPGELVAPHNQSLITNIPASALRLPSSYQAPVLGRAFPKTAFSTSLRAPHTNYPYVRTLHRHDTEITLDLNHPLSGAEIELSARVGTAKNHAACVPMVASRHHALGRLLDTGPGLQAPHVDASADYLATYPLPRADDEADALFYGVPRLVQHLDATAIAEISTLYAQLLDPGMRVLDILSSWKSHLPQAWAPMAGVCLGLNEDELRRNEQLGDYRVHDLNRCPSLPFDDASFDAVICNVSVEYLIRPLEVFAEVFRVLRTGGVFINTFSDRCFPTKAIALWRHLHPFERLQYALSLYKQSGNFKRLHTESVRGLARPVNDEDASRNPFSDPVYAVYGYRE